MAASTAASRAMAANIRNPLKARRHEEPTLSVLLYNTTNTDRPPQGSAGVAHLR